MSGIENPLLLESIYFGSDVVGYYSVYPINIPANYVTSANDLNPNPSGPEPFMTGPWLAFETNDQGFNFDAIADNQVQFQMPSSAPAVNGLIVIGF
jgi:hypothetical protein